MGVGTAGTRFVGLVLQETTAPFQALAGVLRHVRTPDDRPLVEGRQVTGFANSEEAAVGLTEVVPFLVEQAYNGDLIAAVKAAHARLDARLLVGADLFVAEGNLLAHRRGFRGVSGTRKG